MSAEPLKPLGENHSEVHLHTENRDGRIPFVKKGPQEHFEVPVKKLWDHGLYHSYPPYVMYQVASNSLHVCDQLISNKTLLEDLKAKEVKPDTSV